MLGGGILKDLSETWLPSPLLPIPILATFQWKSGALLIFLPLKINFKIHSLIFILYWLGQRTEK